MLRKNPNGSLPVVDDVFIGFNSVVFRTEIDDGCVVRHNCVIDGLNLPEQFHIPPMTNIGSGFDLESITKVPAEYSTFFEFALSANHDLIQGYKRLANEF